MRARTVTKAAPKRIAKKAKRSKKRSGKPTKHAEIAKFIEHWANQCVEMAAERDPKGKWDFSVKSLNRIETFIRERWGDIERDGFTDLWQFVLGAYVSHVFQIRYKLKWLKTKDFGWDLEVCTKDGNVLFTANPFGWIEKRVEGHPEDDVAAKYKMIESFANAAGARIAIRKA